MRARGPSHNPGRTLPTAEAEASGTEDERNGKVRSYADAARQLGVTRARMSQILNLLNLPPRLQEGLLLGDLHLSERRMRALGGRGEWDDSSTSVRV